MLNFHLLTKIFSLSHLYLEEIYQKFLISNNQKPFNLKEKPKGQIVNNIILLSIMNENIFHFFSPYRFVNSISSLCIFKKN